MARLLIPGAMDRHGIAHPLPHCTGLCNGGRTPCKCATGCTEMANDIPMRPDLPPIRVDMTTHRIPFGRRARRLLRDVWAFLMSPSFRG
jgi:hypothetical protein